MGKILSFFASFFTKKGLQLFFIMNRFTIVIFIFSFGVAFSAFFLYTYNYVYDYLVNFLSSLGSISGGSMVPCILYTLDCTGITSAYQNGVNILYFSLSFRFVFLLKSFYSKWFSIFSDEVFKLGLLIGQW